MPFLKMVGLFFEDDSFIIFQSTVLRTVTGIKSDASRVVIMTCVDVLSVRKGVWANRMLKNKMDKRPSPVSKFLSGGRLNYGYPSTSDPEL